MTQFNNLFQYSGKYNNAYKSAKVTRNEFSKFEEELKKFFKACGNASGKEEALKNILQHFIEHVYGYQTAIAEKIAQIGNSSIDLCTKVDGGVRVIFETKDLSKKGELFSVKNTGGIDINHKALQEAIFYSYAHVSDTNRPYLNHIVLTDTEHFIFVDPKPLSNKVLRNLCETFIQGNLFNNKTAVLYTELGELIKNQPINFDFCYFDLGKFKQKVLSGGQFDDTELNELKQFYKVLHPNFLHRQYNPSDANELNEGFYNELLYIFGLKETKENKKLVIGPTGVPSTVYKQIEKRQLTPNKDNAIALITVWLNRILFLKLFESQLISFNANGDSYRFFSSGKVNDGNDLNTLFFYILNTPVCDRMTSDKKEKIPYLNSSLFERKGVEKILTIAEVLKEEIPLFSKSVLKDKKARPFVKYLLDFLDSYSFLQTDETLEKDTKDIINSSVLGSVFEKINGYKEGSFFTPYFVTEYMCKDAIDRVVLAKFSALFPEKEPPENIEELKNLIGSDSHKKNKKELYNSVFDSIRICDPACGSGHFLVSALNYLIYLKSYLHLLPISNPIEIHNDMLVVYSREEGKQFAYKRNDPVSTKIQKAIFHEKANIIKNCLFGADINPTSVEICRLRLWIELLKHAYYKDNSDEMELLPNIDYNIKCGDSLSTTFRPVGGTLALFADPEKYQSYKVAHDNYKSGVYRSSKQADYDELQKLKEDLLEGARYTDQLIDGLQWQVEFPEILSDQGDFIGFDLVIGNPPYIQLQADKGRLSKLYENLDYTTFAKKGDIYSLFYEQGYHLLRDGGYLSFITSNNWQKVDYGQSTRKFFVDCVDLLQFIDFGKVKIFDNATINTCILTFRKSKSQARGKCPCCLNATSKTIPADSSQFLPMTFTYDSWSILEDVPKLILSKINSKGNPLGSWTGIEIYGGVSTGFNEAFILDKAKKESILKKCSTKKEKRLTESIIKRAMGGDEIARYGSSTTEDVWLVATFPAVQHDIKKTPALEQYMLSFDKRRLEQTGKKFIKNNEEVSARRKGTGKWFETRDDIAYWKKFKNKKIAWGNLAERGKFTLVAKDVCIYSPASFITSDSMYLLGFLNSKLSAFFVKTCAVARSGGFLEYRPFYVKKIPVVDPNSPNLTTEEKDLIHDIESFTTDRLRAKLPDRRANLEKKIDEAIYKLYDLTPKEIDYLEKLFPSS